MRRTHLAIAATAAICLSAATPASAVPADTMVTNGSFEEPDIPTGTFQILASVPGWFHAARLGTSSTGIEIQDHRAGAPAPGAGDQFLELDSNGPSRVFQDVPTTPGVTHRLAFLYSPRPSTVAQQNHFAVSAASTGTTIGPIAGGPQTKWAPVSLDFVPGGTSSRIEFLDLGPEDPGTAGFGAYIDEVSVVPVYGLCLLYDPGKSHKQGSTVPLKLQLCDSTGQNVSSSSHVVHVTGLTKVDDSSSAVVEDSGHANPDDDFRYDAELAGYIFNLSTKELTSGTWRVSFTVDGGSTTYSLTFDVR